MAAEFRPGAIEAMVMQLDGAGRSDEVIEELHSLHERDVVRVIDILVVGRDVEGTAWARGSTELSNDEASYIRQVLSDTLGFQVGGHAVEGNVRWEGVSIVLGAEDVKFVVDILPPGHAALAVVFEHRWASRLDQLIHGTGVKLIEDDVLRPQGPPRPGGITATP